MPTSRGYHSYLIEALKDPQEAAAYLDAVLEDCDYDEMLLALRNVAEAHLSETAGSDKVRKPENLQEILSPQANLDLIVLMKALGKLGLKLSVTTVENAA